MRGETPALVEVHATDVQLGASGPLCVTRPCDILSLVRSGIETAPIHKNVTIPENHRLHLDIELPQELPVGEAQLTVVVTPLRQPNKAQAIEALRELARSGGVTTISDPSKWQRKTRRDRPLPGRN